MYQITHTICLKDGSELELTSQSKYKWSDEVDVNRLELRSQFVKFGDVQSEQFIVPKDEILFISRTVKEISGGDGATKDAKE